MKRSRPSTLEPFSGSLLLVALLHISLAFAAWRLWLDHGTRMQGGPHGHLMWMSPQDFSAPLPPPSSPTVTPAPVAAVATTTPAPQSTAAKKEEEPAPKATLVAAPPDQHRMEPTPNNERVPLFAPATPRPKPPANRSITLRRVGESSAPRGNLAGRQAPPITSPTLLDIVRLNRMRQPPAAPSTGAIKKSVPDDTALDAVDEALNSAFLAAWTAPPISDVPQHQREARLNVSVAADGSIAKAQMVRFSGSHLLDQSILQAAAQVKKISATLPSNFDKESYDLELNFLLLP